MKIKKISQAYLYVLYDSHRKNWLLHKFDFFFILKTCGFQIFNTFVNSNDKMPMNKKKLQSAKILKTNKIFAGFEIRLV